MTCPECYEEKYGELFTDEPDDAPNPCARHIRLRAESRTDEQLRADLKRNYSSETLNIIEDVLKKRKANK